MWVPQLRRYITIATLIRSHDKPTQETRSIAAEQDSFKALKTLRSYALKSCNEGLGLSTKAQPSYSLNLGFRVKGSGFKCRGLGVNSDKVYLRSSQGGWLPLSG